MFHFKKGDGERQVSVTEHFKYFFQPEYTATHFATRSRHFIA